MDLSTFHTRTYLRSCSLVSKADLERCFIPFRSLLPSDVHSDHYFLAFSPSVHFATAVSHKFSFDFHINKNIMAINRAFRLAPLLTFFLFLTDASSVTGSNNEAAISDNFDLSCDVYIGWGYANSEVCIPMLLELSQPLYLTSSFSWNLQIVPGNPGINVSSKCQYVSSESIDWDARQSLYAVLKSGSLWTAPDDYHLDAPPPRLGCNDVLTVAVNCQQDESGPQSVLIVTAPPTCGKAIAYPPGGIYACSQLISSFMDASHA